MASSLPHQLSPSEEAVVVIVRNNITPSCRRALKIKIYSQTAERIEQASIVVCANGSKPTCV
ncbi:hypothetical protein PCASD_09625 [Puccinia coronata f. sp. avenae]|uniref:Uncharacterized protein n=1 Tax=Puccinia coronata f. sp. avenae TaxID=200324 RepID=A0A2N5UPL7_9BASI|nr:hypothetical protein PCASD_09625 [Puccinia coronata f. sp. avenae]